MHLALTRDFKMNNLLFVPDEIKKHLSNEPFEALMQMQGKAFRDVRGRKTIQVAVNNKSYFIKQHFGVGWSEIFKNILSFKKPILGAMTEVQAIKKLDEIGIKTTPLVAYGQQGCNPASMRSFVMTQDLGEIVTIEELCVNWPEYSASYKLAIMQAIAQCASKLHSAGLVHRDFYLCHFVFKKQNLKIENTKIEHLHLIDLHRMLQNQKPNSRAVMKDIAGLYFSMRQIGLNEDSWALFKQAYLPQNDAFWAQVDTRANVLLAKFNSARFQNRLVKEKSALN